MVTEHYEKNWTKANEWINEHAPAYVIWCLEELHGIIRKPEKIIQCVKDKIIDAYKLGIEDSKKYYRSWVVIAFIYTAIIFFLIGKYS